MEENNDTIKDFSIDKIPQPEDINDVIFNLMVNPNLSPLNYFNDFSDSDPGSKMEESDVDEAGLFELGDGSTLMSMTMHAMHHHLEQDPLKATEILVSRAARKMISVGAEPVALSAMLYHINYGDPNGHFIASAAKKGLEESANKFGLNFSHRKIRFDYFGEHGTQSPTIIVSLIGTFKGCKVDECKPMTPDFKEKGNNIFMIGKSVNDISSSEYLEFYHEVTTSPLPEFDIDLELSIQKALKELINRDLVTCVNPIAKGGLFFTLLRAGWKNELGFDITTDAETRTDAFLFGESMGRVMVAVKEDREDEFLDFLSEFKIPFFTLGHVTKGEIRIDDESYGYIDKMGHGI